MDASPSSAIRSSNKNDCPFCGQPKTSWSLKCQTCEADRQRYIAGKVHASDDIQFLSEVEQFGQSGVARRLHISRQAVSLRVRKARQRIEWASNPFPMATSAQDVASV